MVEVKWTDFAIQNLNEIGDYIEKKSYTSYASRVVSGLFAAGGGGRCFRTFSFGRAYGSGVSRYDYKRAYPDESLPDCLQSG